MLSEILILLIPAVPVLPLTVRLFISHVQATEVLLVYRSPIEIFLPQNRLRSISVTSRKSHELPSGHITLLSVVSPWPSSITMCRASLTVPLLIKFTAWLMSITADA